MEQVIMGMDHPAIVFKDFEKTCKWYCDVLEYEVVAAVENGPKLLKSPDGTFIEAMPTDGAERPVRDYFAEGVSHIAFRVGSIPKACSVLESRGVVWTCEIKSAVGGGNIRNFQDPEGNELQLVERV